MTAAPFLRCLIWLLMPLNVLFSLWKKLLARMLHLDGDNQMSPEELLMLVNEVQQEGSIDKDEGDLLKKMCIRDRCGAGLEYAPFSKRSKYGIIQQKE